jgi:hypothetical protein
LKTPVLAPDSVVLAKPAQALRAAQRSLLENRRIATVKFGVEGYVALKCARQSLVKVPVHIKALIFRLVCGHAQSQSQMGIETESSLKRIVILLVQK